MSAFFDKYNGNVIIIEKSAIRSLGPKQFFEAAWVLFFYFKAEKLLSRQALCPASWPSG